MFLLLEASETSDWLEEKEDSPPPSIHHPPTARKHYINYMNAAESGCELAAIGLILGVLFVKLSWR